MRLTLGERLPAEDLTHLEDALGVLERLSNTGAPAKAAS